MRFSGVSALAIWNNATRSLTNTGGMAAASTIVSTTLAAAASVDLRQAAGFSIDITVSVKTGGAATASITIVGYDGTQNYTVATTAAAANSMTGFTGISDSGVGLRINNNDGANAGAYMFSGLLWKF